jgi:arginase family enzyme
MDVRHYFEPVDFTRFSGNENYPWKNSLGQLIEKATEKLTSPNLRQMEVAIFGVPFDNGSNNVGSAKSPDKIREELYRLVPTNRKINIVDFGNLRETNNMRGVYLAIRDVVEYLNELRVVIVIIGGSQDLTQGICEAFKNQPFFTLSCVDAFLDIKKEKNFATSYLSKIFQTHPGIFQFSLLGYQSHYVGAGHLSKIKGLGIHLRLGLLRDNFSDSEPILRNTDVLSFDIGALKYSDAPGSSTINPNGLRSEEACQLAKYAGISNKLKVFGLFNVNPDNDMHDTTIKLSAQIIWYFLEGITSRTNEKPGESGDFLTYKVEIKDVDQPLVFFFSKETMRWWMEIESVNGEKATIACSEREYQQAANNEIPGLWLKYVQKTDELSK